jgi:lactoylglutathione lyase
MKVGYVVLYVNDVSASSQFWIEKIGMVIKDKSEAGSFSIPRLGFPDQDFSFELVPLELMGANPDGLNLGSPSVAFYVPSLEAMRESLVANNVTCSEIADHSGVSTFGFSDNEERWFGVLEK